MASNTAHVLLYWGGSVHISDDVVEYIGGKKRMVILPCQLTFLDLLARVSEATDFPLDQYALTLTCTTYEENVQYSGAGSEQLHEFASQGLSYPESMQYRQIQYDEQRLGPTGSSYAGPSSQFDSGPSQLTSSTQYNSVALQAELFESVRQMEQTDFERQLFGIPMIIPQQPQAPPQRPSLGVRISEPLQLEPPRQSTSVRTTKEKDTQQSEPPRKSSARSHPAGHIPTRSELNVKQKKQKKTTDEESHKSTGQGGKGNDKGGQGGGGGLKGLLRRWK